MYHANYRRTEEVEERACREVHAGIEREKLRLGRARNTERDAQTASLGLPSLAAAKRHYPRLDMLTTLFLSLSLTSSACPSHPAADASSLSLTLPFPLTRSLVQTAPPSPPRTSRSFPRSRRPSRAAPRRAARASVSARRGGGIVRP